jgi:UDP-N-acetylmuramate dehydrogenase
LRPLTTLRIGGDAEHLVECCSADELAAAAQLQFDRRTVLGSGSNVLPSDAGVPGLVVLNRAQRIAVAQTGEVVAETGAMLQELFLKTAQAGLQGLEFAVGIPGTVGGALVSNAGAYRSCVSEYLTGIEIADGTKREWVDPSWMQFSYRDSLLRRPAPPAVVMLRVSLKLPPGDPKSIFDSAREFQRQRISKQPPGPSAGSFFKNVNDRELADRLAGLPGPLRLAGVVPAGYLIEAVGLKGHRVGGAMLGVRHANFILNVGGASASDVRRLATRAKAKVLAEFGTELEEEVLYIGDWSGFSP